MIYHYKMKQPEIIPGGAGDGTKSNPWYWYSLTQGQTINIDNSNISGDNGRLYIRVKLNAGTTYYIGETGPGGGDGKIWLYDENGNELTYNDDWDSEIAGVYCWDHFEYTPSNTGIYIIGAGAYSGARGSYTVAISQLPEYDPVPQPEVVYYTSTGFNDFGKAIKYRSASLADCNINRIPKDGLVFYHSFDGRNITISDIGNKTLNLWSGTINYIQEEGIPCGLCDHVGMTISKIDTINNNPFAASIWFKGNSSTVSGDLWMISPGTSGISSGIKISIDISGNKFNVTSSGDYWYSTTNTFDLTKWHSLIINTDGSTIQFYVDGNLEISNSLWNILPDNRTGTFGAADSRFPYLYGYISSARIYNHILTTKEITALANEFKI